MAPADPIEHAVARQVAAAVLALPGIAGLHPGEFDEVALLYPGDRVRGMRLETGAPVPRLEVHVVVDLNTADDLHELSERVRTAAGAHVRFPVDVIVADAVAGRTTQPGE